MTADNPFAAPEIIDEVQSPRRRRGSVGGIEVDGKCLVVRSGVTLPQRCVKTNDGEGVLERRKTLSWAPGWIWVLILINILVLLIGYLLARKTCELRYAITSEALGAHRMRGLITFIVLVGSVGLMVFGIANERELGDSTAVPVLIGVVGVLTSLILSTTWVPVVKVAKHRDGRFWIKGCCQEYLDAVASEVEAAKGTRRRVQVV